MQRYIVRLGMPLLLLFVLVACSGGNLFPTAPATRDATLTGNIIAQVTSAGSPAGGIEIVLNATTVRTTDALGQARFENLAPGPYTVSIRVPAGFLLDTTVDANQNVNVAAGGIARVTWSIRPQENVGGNPRP